jgi:membrane protein DedA with SNARE-associated domain
MSDPLAVLAQWVTNVVYSLGYVGIGVLTVVEVVFPPIPSELILPLAGFLASQGRFAFPVVILAATIGSVTGALILYALGRRVGEEKLRRFVKRYGRWLLVDESDLDRAQQWFEQHGRMAILIGRLVPGVRSFISIPAGIEKMSLLWFVVFTALGNSIWNTVLAALGWWLGSQWEQVRQYAQVLEYGALVLLLGALAWFVWRRVKSTSK